VITLQRHGRRGWTVIVNGAVVVDAATFAVAFAAAKEQP
jgi:hypothetical protein